MVIYVLSYVLDRPFENRTSALENKMASICLVFKWLDCQIFGSLSKQDNNKQKVNNAYVLLLAQLIIKILLNRVSEADWIAMHNNTLLLLFL